jgi:hypothetical protein
MDYTPEQVMEMNDEELCETMKRRWNCTHLISSEHKYRLRPIEEFSISLRRKAEKKGINDKLEKPRTTNARMLRSDLENPIKGRAYARIHDALRRGAPEEIPEIQLMRGRDLIALDIGIRPAPHTYPMIKPPLEYYLKDCPTIRRAPPPPTIRRAVPLTIRRAIKEEVAIVAERQAESDKRQIAIATATIFLNEKVQKQTEEFATLQARVTELELHAEKTSAVFRAQSAMETASSRQEHAKHHAALKAVLAAFNA